MDFNSEIQRIQGLCKKDEYTPAAVQCMIVTEQAFRLLTNRYLDRVDKEVTRQVQEATRKRGRQHIDGLTMGQLVHVFQESAFLEACARIAGKDLSSLEIINLPKLTQLRNKLIHHAKEAEPEEAEFLLHCLKIILKTFELSEIPAKKAASGNIEILFRDGHALIIGVGGADLPNTVDDAHGLADILKDAERCAYPHEQVTVLTGPDATRSKIFSAFATLKEQTDTESTVIIYFSGHGYQISSAAGNAYYLMPYGYNLQSLATTAISGAEFAELLKAIPAKKLLLLLDCCHAAGIGDIKAPATMVKKSVPPEVFPLLSEGQGRVLIASSKDDEFSYAGKPYSVFTLALLEALCGTDIAKKDGCVRVADVTRYTGRIVPKRTDDRQNPIWDFSQADNFVVSYYAGGEIEPKAPPFDSSESSFASPMNSQYDYDICVSFADVDDQRRPDDKEGWVTTFTQNLRVILDQKLGNSEAYSLWGPRQLPGHVLENETIKEVIEKSALFIVILSRAYLTSEWCQAEKINFLEQVKKNDLLANSRVFIVERDQLERPREFAGVKGYQFWVKDREGRPARTLTPKRDDDLYYDTIEDLCYDLAHTLQKIKSFRN